MTRVLPERKGMTKIHYLIAVGIPVTTALTCSQRPENWLGVGEDGDGIQSLSVGIRKIRIATKWPQHSLFYSLRYGLYLDSISFKLQMSVLCEGQPNSKWGGEQFQGPGKSWWATWTINFQDCRKELGWEGLTFIFLRHLERLRRRDTFSSRKVFKSSPNPSLGNFFRAYW